MIILFEPGDADDPAEIPEDIQDVVASIITQRRAGRDTDRFFEVP